MTYQIDKNVPMPSASTKQKVPVASMEVGDSIVVQAKSAGGASIIFSAGARALGIIDRRFTSAPVGDGLYRVWRIA